MIPRPWMVLGCGAMSAALLLACRQKKVLTLTPTPKTAAGRYYRLSIDKVEECDPIYPARLGKGNMALGIHASIEATTNEKIYVPQLAVTDSKGNSYRTMTSDGCQPPLFLASNVEKGQKPSGWVTFEVPETATGLTFSCQPALVKAGKSPDNPWAVRVDDTKASFELVR
jgi:hypothetical protein